MEVDSAPVEVLLQRPWLPVNISGCHLLAKSWFGDTAYHIVLTDMNCVWEERMDSAAIQRRAQELNRRLRAPVEAFFSHLCEVVQPCLLGSTEQSESEAPFSLTQQEDGNISIKLKSELAGLPFYWEFHCTPAPVTLVCVLLVRPLLAMSHVLQRQVEQLGGLLHMKDAEIQDYRENGATLSRERLQTEVFDDQTYRKDFMAKTFPLLCSEEKDTFGFCSDLQQLYAAVNSHRNARKHKPSIEHLVEKDQTFTDKSELTMPLVSSEAAEDTEQKGQNDTAKAKTANRSTLQKSQPVTSNPPEQPSTKPKKMKVGLFR